MNESKVKRVMAVKKKFFPLILFLLAAVILWVFWPRLFGREHNDARNIYGNVDIRTVNLSLRVGGRLASLAVEEGDGISAGQVLGQLDARPYENALAQAEADVEMQKAQLSLLEAGFRDEEIAQVRSEVQAQRLALDYAEKFYQRQQALLPDRAVSANDVDNARTARDSARSSLQAALEKLRMYEAGNRVQQIDAARAALMQAEAALEQSRLNLSDTVLVSPADGVVLTRAVEPGTMLAPGSAVYVLSLTRPVWARAYVSGAGLHLAVPGAKVDVYIDGRPDKPYRGTIGFVSPSAEFTPKQVQTPDLRPDLVYRLRILIDDPDDALRQGMPITARLPG